MSTARIKKNDTVIVIAGDCAGKTGKVLRVLPSKGKAIVEGLNKVKKAVGCASCIQSVDRIELLEEIEKQAANLNKEIQVLFEFHTGEESKSGFADLDSLLPAVEYACQAPHIIPRGFMTMAPFTDNQLEIAASFKKLVSIQQQVASRFPSLDLRELSMGMSNDYAIAIAEGATMVRIGTAIFGERVY